MTIKEKVIKVLECQCLRCDYQWTSRKAVRPPCCPQCGRKNWWKPGNKVEAPNIISKEDVAQVTKVNHGKPVLEFD